MKSFMSRPSERGQLCPRESQLPNSRTRLSVLQSMLDSWLFALLIVLGLHEVAVGAASRSTKTENVLFVMTDGLRWQEVFSGAEELLLNSNNGGVKHVEPLRAEYWRATPEERRRALMPFLWGEVATRGQIFGNQTKGSIVKVTNGLKFSYPGYSEIVTGIADPRIQSNDKMPNPNLTVFEWLNGLPQYRGRIATFGGWDVVPYILNCERGKLPTWPEWEPRFRLSGIKQPHGFDELMRGSNLPWRDVVFDAWLGQAALEHVKSAKPRVIYVGFGETDEWAHDNRYDLVLQAANRVDQFLGRLWSTIQAMPQYRDKTTLIFTTDHGRGSGPKLWRDHGEKVDGAEGIFLAVIGPDTAPLGERVNCAAITQSQIAATMAALLGEDFRSVSPKAAPAIAELAPSR